MKIAHKNFRLFSVFLILFWSAITACCQEGYPFMSHFSFNEIIDRENSDLLQDDHNNILFANRKGILTFDSRSWNLLPLPYSPLCLEKSIFDRTIYAGCRNGFGILVTDETGKYEYIPIHSVDSTGEINSISITSSKVFFISQNRIFQVQDKDHQNQKYWEFPFECPVTGSFVHNDSFYFTLHRKGLFRAVSDTFETISATGFPENTEIVFSLSPDPGNVLIGCSNNSILIFDGSVFKTINITDNKYLTESIITDGAFLGNNRIAVSTLLGGVMILDYKTGLSDHIINFNSGLPDDEVFCLGTDNGKALLLCHSFGVTRIDPWLNVRNYTWFPGLQGNLTQTVYFRNKLYVGTSDGVYILEEIRDYTEKVIYEKSYKPRPAEPGKTDEQAPVQENLSLTPETTQSPVKKSPFLRRARDRILKVLPRPRQEVTAEEPKKTLAVRPSAVRTDHKDYTLKKKKIYSLQSISHKYTPVPGIRGKCTELADISGHLIAATNSGLYEISDNSSIQILPYENIQFINFIPGDQRFFAGSGESLFIIQLQEGSWEIIKEMDALGFTSYSAYMTDDSTLWIGSDNGAYKLKTDSDFYIDETQYIPISTTFSDNISLKLLNDSLYFFLSAGIYKLENDSVINICLFNDLYSLPSYYLSVHQAAIYRSGEKWSVINRGVNIPEAYLNIFSSVQDITVDSEGNTWVIANNRQIFRISHEKDMPGAGRFAVHFSSLKSKRDELLPLIKPEISYTESSLKIDFSAPFYITPGKTEFRYMIKGLRDEWSDWSTASTVEYPLIPPGAYSLHLQAKNLFGSMTDETIMEFRIKPPFYKTDLFYALLAFLVIFIFVMIIRIREKNLKHARDVLEEKVQERTAEIERQKNELAEQKKEITDSIFYAKRIQSAIFPSLITLKKHLSDHFVLFIPRDIVSGDFYWSIVKNKKIVLTAADCTGHGVPGAFMSILGVTLLHEIVGDSSLDNAGSLLNSLRSNISNALSQSGDPEQRDGMDISLCIIDKQAMQMHFSGAFNSLYMIRDNSLTEIKADKMPIGLYEKADSFIDNLISLREGDIFYMFSDGFVDQFGGPRGKKYLIRPFQDFLLNIHENPMEIQKELLHAEFSQWKGKLSQVDDVLIIGFRI